VANFHEFFEGLEREIEQRLFAPGVALRPPRRVARNADRELPARAAARRWPAVFPPRDPLFIGCLHCLLAFFDAGQFVRRSIPGRFTC